MKDWAVFFLYEKITDFMMGRINIVERSHMKSDYFVLVKIFEKEKKNIK